MNSRETRAKRQGRTRVMIVDPKWHFGLKLADCLATDGYQAILVRSLESMIAELGELQPGAILLHAESSSDRLGGHGADTLATVKALCPQAPMLVLSEPDHDTQPQISQCKSHDHPPFIPSNRMEEWLHTKLGIPCARVI